MLHGVIHGRAELHARVRHWLQRGDLTRIVQRLLAAGNDRPLSDLLRAAELFPFAIESGASQVTQSPRLQVYQQGQEMTLVHV